MAPKPLDPMVRFMRRVDTSGDCWLWTGTTGGTKSTYGYFRPGTRSTDPNTLVHRWMYQQRVGPIPDGYEVDHTCATALCVNPDHLEAVTPAENQRRKRLTVCSKGLHDLSNPANRRSLDALGRSQGCKPCRRAWDRARNKRRRSK